MAVNHGTISISTVKHGTLTLTTVKHGTLTVFEPSGYSGNILSSFPSAGQSSAYGLCIKFGSVPSSDDDYDAYLPKTYGSSIQGSTSYSGQTVAYLWCKSLINTGGGAKSGAKIVIPPTPPTTVYPRVSYNGTETTISETSYSSPYTLTLTGNYDITLIIPYRGGGGSK